jgi:sulfate transport system ATP-binding protein
LHDGQLQVAGLALPAPETPLSSGPVDLYVRPEDLAPGDSGWAATVLSAQRSGSRLRLRAQLAHGQDEVEVDVPAGEGAARYVPGQTLQLSARRFGVFAQQAG